MWRIDESMIGSYTGRMAPPGSPNITSTPCISRLLMRAWAPVNRPWAVMVFPLRRAPPGWSCGWGLVIWPVPRTGAGIKTTSHLGGRGARDERVAWLRDQYDGG